MDLTLHVADDNGLINLGGIVPPGAHYTATRNENSGVVRLVPVRVATTAAIVRVAVDDIALPGTPTA